MRLLQEETGAVGNLVLPEGAVPMLPTHGLAVKNQITVLEHLATSVEPIDVERLRRAARDLAALLAEDAPDAVFLPAGLRTRPRAEGCVFASAHLQWSLERLGIVVLFPDSDNKMALADYDNAATVAIMRRSHAPARAIGWRARWNELKEREDVANGDARASNRKTHPERLTMAGYVLDDIDAIEELRTLDPKMLSEVDDFRRRVHPIPWVAEVDRRWWSKTNRRAA